MTVSATAFKNDGVMPLESQSTVHQQLSPDDHMTIPNQSKKMAKNKAEMAAVQQRMFAEDSFKQKHLRVPKVKTGSKVGGTKKGQPVVDEQDSM